MIELAIIIAAFATIIAMVYLKVDINIALLAGASIILAYFSGTSTLSIIKRTIEDERTLFLLSASFTISIFAELYRRTGAISEFSRGVASKIKSPKSIIALVPALLGLLPIAGGALMSAPIVDAVGRELSIAPDLMVFLNVWFRHVLFLFYPMGQSLIIASATFNYDPISLAILQLPIAIAMAVSGFFYMKNFKNRGFENFKYSMSLWISGTPLFISIISSLVLNGLVGSYGIPIGVSIGIITLVLLLKPKREQVLGSLKSRMVISLATSSFSIMLLQHSIVDTGASFAIADAIKSSSIPLILLETIVPGVLSGLTSSTVTGIVTVAPIISSFHQISIYEASLIYTSSFISYTISPTHLCLIYTSNYFRRGVVSSYKYMLPAALSVILFTVLYYSLLSFFTY
ncbi:MAG: DUF401 family protein [Fervidicoccaceae archaeon]